MNKLVIGILAHVDAGKTTLSESLLYLSGKIRKLGRVDNKDAYLDTYALEKERGITIFSKQAMMTIENTQLTLLDTPGHVDFSAEMERTLQVLDYAILVISGADGIQGHTYTLWKLLETYNVPVFVFINKMDQPHVEKSHILNEIKQRLSENCIDFSDRTDKDFNEQLAMCHEGFLDTYMQTGVIEEAEILAGIVNRQIFPCFFGSALKLDGVEYFLDSFIHLTKSPTYLNELGGRVFKVTRDEQGNRLTHLKITGGTLKVKDIITKGEIEEKVNQIRLYSGEKFEAASQVSAGTICAVVGLSQIRPGEGIGFEELENLPILEPVLCYRMLLPEGCDPRIILPKLRQIEEESPELHITWDEVLQEIQVQLMGEIQTEILQCLIQTRFGIQVQFDAGKILYKETIIDRVEGVGHFEPLRHYSEVHLLLEPGEPGSGVELAVQCSEDLLEKNWQRLVLTHLQEKVHRGVLTGSMLTDVKITLVSGRAHKKHTEGGDFREATYRAVRQGLMQAHSVLLEPYYEFSLELPEKLVGRAMMDIEKMSGECTIKESNGLQVLLVGKAPVLTMRNYQKEVLAYSKGEGRLVCTPAGYAPCHNAEEIIHLMRYNPEEDSENPSGSIFCAHGSGFSVPWYQVKDHMHIESYLKKAPNKLTDSEIEQGYYEEERLMSLEEIDSIISRTFFANQGQKSIWKKRKTARESYYTPTSRPSSEEVKKHYLLVDGYNIIFAWSELRELADDNMDGARIKLLEILSNYQALKKEEIIVVFDAYRVKGHHDEMTAYQNIYVVFTKEAQTADHYIERFANTHQYHAHVTVATSDGLQQVIIRGSGSRVLSARELKEEISQAQKNMLESYHQKTVQERHYLSDALEEQGKTALQDLLNHTNDA